MRATAVLESLFETCDERFEAGQPDVDTLPGGGDQLDKQSEIVHTCVALAGRVSLDAFQAVDHLVHEPTDLGEIPGDRRGLVPQPLLDRALDSFGKTVGCGGGCLRERFQFRACPFEGAVDRGSVGALSNAFLRPLDRALVHTWQMYRGNGMKTSELDYFLPPALIAQQPQARRDEARLLLYDRVSGQVDHRTFAELPDVVGDALVVLNDTRVVPARIPIERPRGEVLLLEPVADDGLWEGLAKPSRRLRAGRRYGPVELLEHLGEGRWLLRLHGEPAGETPLPPYITEPLGDPERYQTVYARTVGSAAAPTAGLHFTREVLQRLDVERVTLHVGLDTFRPVTATTLEEHELHGERYEVTPEAWERIRAAPRVLAVGTTTVRVLETLARGRPLAGRTDLFITPGFDFRRADALLTNFHLPCSTLLALVMAFAGVEETRALYREAIERRYRFYSFGDAMLVT